MFQLPLIYSLMLIPKPTTSDPATGDTWAVVDTAERKKERKGKYGVVITEVPLPPRPAPEPELNDS